MPRICQHYPILTLDNFFDHPEEVIKEANSLGYHRDPTENWPGLRTDSLNEVSPEIYFYTLKKLFSVWHSPEEVDRIGCDCSMFFQRISPPVENNPSSPLNKGWVHRDYPNIATGVIYLTPNADPNTGTGFYTDEQNLWRPGRNPYTGNSYLECKNKVYGQRFEESEISVLEDRKRVYDEQFHPDIIVSNRYNRLIYFGEQYPHREEYLGSKTSDGERLTLVFFIADVKRVNTPLLRMLRGV